MAQRHTLSSVEVQTTYHTSIERKPTRVFHGLIPHIILDHKLGKNSNEKLLPTTDFAVELQRKRKY